MTQAARPRWLIVGAGSFGTTFARILGGKPVDVTLAARSTDHVAAMRETNSNERYFPGIAFPDDTRIVTIDDALQEQWDVVVLAVPTSAFEQTLTAFAGRAPRFLSLAKGLHPSGRRLGEVAAEIVAPEQFVVLSGPNIAREMMQDLPTAAVLAGVDMEAVLELQQVVNGYTFRVYANDDVVGVELAGASKNVIAIAAGVLEGSGLGDNGVAAMMTRGLGEMATLGLAHGARVQTYLGLAGVGDLMVTCRSPHSRNHRAGRLLAEGMGVEQIRSEIGQAIEGFRTAPVVREMAHAAGVDMHICEAVAQVVADDAPLAEVVRQMMSRPPGMEFSSRHQFELQ